MTQKFTVCVELDNVDDIAPWGEDDDRHLHWFGLTSGRYWITTPLGEVYRYTEEACREFGTDSRYVDYQVSRLFEDLQEGFPFFMEPIPADMAAIASDTDWYSKSKAWRENQSVEDGELWFDALQWWHSREIDTAHLRHGPRLRFWRVKEDVFFRWEYRGKDPVWCIPSGQVQISSTEFRSAIESFFDGVIGAMQTRVDEIALNGWRRNDCKLDVRQFVAEQAQRAARLQQVKRALPHTDWNKARALLQELQRRIDQ